MAQDKKARKPKGDGSIQQLPNGKYKVQVTIGRDVNGKQIRKSVTINSQKEAVSIKNKLINEQQEGALVKPNKCKLSDYIERWLSMKETQLKKTTFESYDYICRKYLFPSLGMLQLQKLTTAQINDYFNIKIKEGISPRTLSKHKIILHGVIDTAIKEGLLSLNPVNNCRSLGSKRETMKVFSPNEIKQLLDTAKNIATKKGKHFTQIYHIVLLALATGMRRGEVLALKWDCIDREKNTVTIAESISQVKGGLHIDVPKSKSSRRTISVDQRVLMELQELKLEGSDFVFHTNKGKPLSPENVGRSYRNLLAEVGLKGFRFHDLRHTHATQLIAEGFNIKMVSERLGHNDISVTLQLYVHALPKQDREAAERMASCLFG